MADNHDDQNSPAVNSDGTHAGVLSSPEGLTFDGDKTTNEGKVSENDEDDKTGGSRAVPSVFDPVAAPEPNPSVFDPVVRPSGTHPYILGIHHTFDGAGATKSKHRAKETPDHVYVRTFKTPKEEEEVTCPQGSCRVHAPWKLASLQVGTWLRVFLVVSASSTMREYSIRSSILSPIRRILLFPCSPSTWMGTAM